MTPADAAAYYALAKQALIDFGPWAIGIIAGAAFLWRGPAFIAAWRKPK